MTSTLLAQVIAGMPEDFAHPDHDYRVTRERMAPLHGHPVAPDTSVDPTVAGGVPVERLTRPDVSTGAGTALFFHGGAFVSCDAAAYRFYAEFIADQLGLTVVTVDYRLAPEHRGPAALDDCSAAYRGLLDQGQPAGSLLCIGDSCGGGLALATVCRARDAGLAMPAAVVSLSGWVDLDTRAYGGGPPSSRDPFVTEGFLRARARDYLGPAGDPRAPWASPSRGELAGLPPLLLQVGETDLCRRDAEVLADRATRAGVVAALDVVAGGIHGVQGLVDLGVPEAVAAWQAVGRFVDVHLNR